MAERVCIRPGVLADEEEFLAAVRQSRKLHHPWVQPPGTSSGFRDYLGKRVAPRGAAFFVWVERPRGLVGVINHR